MSAPAAGREHAARSSFEGSCNKFKRSGYSVDSCLLPSKYLLVLSHDHAVCFSTKRPHNASNSSVAVKPA